MLGFAPVPVPPHVFALDATRLRYGQFVRDRQGFRCRAIRETPLPRDAFHSGLLGGPLRDFPGFRGIVGTLLRSVVSGGGGRGVKIKDASLVIPDAWLRVAFTESGDLPKSSEQLDEVLRWKLRRLVPFRVDELRVSAAEVPPLPDQEEPRRLLLGFGVEQLLAQLEDAFAAHGIRLGQISNESLSMLASLSVPQADELTALALVDAAGYTLVFVRAGTPVLHRYKGFAGSLPEGSKMGFVVRDLKLTRNFLDEHFPGVPLAKVLLAAPPELEPMWVDLLAEGLGEPAAPLDGRHLPPLRSEEGTVPSWRELAPLLGASRQEVA